MAIILSAVLGCLCFICCCRYLWKKQQEVESTLVQLVNEQYSACEQSVTKAVKAEFKENKFYEVINDAMQKVVNAAIATGENATVLKDDLSNVVIISKKTLDALAETILNVQTTLDANYGALCTKLDSNAEYLDTIKKHMLKLAYDQDIQELGDRLKSLQTQQIETVKELNNEAWGKVADAIKNEKRQEAVPIKSELSKATAAVQHTLAAITGMTKDYTFLRNDILNKCDYVRSELLLDQMGKVSKQNQECAKALSHSVNNLEFQIKQNVAESIKQPLEETERKLIDTIIKVNKILSQQKAEIKPQELAEVKPQEVVKPTQPPVKPKKQAKPQEPKKVQKKAKTILRKSDKKPSSSKITPEIVDAVMALRSTGLPYNKIGEQLSLSAATVYKIHQGAE